MRRPRASFAMRIAVFCVMIFFRLHAAKSFLDCWTSLLDESGTISPSTPDSQAEAPLLEEDSMLFFPLPPQNAFLDDLRAESDENLENLPEIPSLHRGKRVFAASNKEIASQ